MQQHSDELAAQARACASAEAAAPSLDPATVSVRVFNATDKAGEAQKVTIALKDRGFSVGESANDPTDRKVTGVGEIRYGARGREAGAFLAGVLAGSGPYPDGRAT